MIKPILCAVAIAVAAPASAATFTVIALKDIFLAGQPNGATVTGYFGTDTAPHDSPVQLATTAGMTLTFSAIGATSVDQSCFAGPDGGCYSDLSFFSPPPASNTYKGPANALLGIFYDNSAFDAATGPASLDFTNAANTSLASQSPALFQIFYIGDGLTGTGTGSVQQFIAPTGTTRLFLATADSIGANFDNAGSLTVDVTGATLVAGVPEPASWALLIAGFGLTGTALRRRAAAVTN